MCSVHSQNWVVVTKWMVCVCVCAVDDGAFSDWNWIGFDNYRSDLAEINVKTNTNPSAVGISNERNGLPLAQMSIATLGYMHTRLQFQYCWALLLLYFYFSATAQLHIVVVRVFFLCALGYFPLISANQCECVSSVHMCALVHPPPTHPLTHYLVHVCERALSSSVYYYRKKKHFANQSCIYYTYYLEHITNN